MHDEKNNWLLLTIALILFASFALLACKSESDKIIELYASNFKIDLPAGMTVEFNADNISWPSDGERYTVFKLANEPTEFIADFADRHEDDFDSSFNHRKSVDKIIEKLQAVEGANVRIEIPKEFLFSWEEVYCWKATYLHGNSLYIIYFPTSMKMILCCDLL